MADVLAALAATSRMEICKAALLLCGSFWIMAGYDLPGVIFARRIATFPRLGLNRIGLASFCAYALSHVLGVPALTSGAIRLRLYAHWGVPPAGLARIMALSGSTFSIGLTTMLGLLLLIDPLAVPVFGHAAPDMLRLLGAVLASVAAAYVLAARGRDSVKLWKWQIALPGARLAMAQVMLSVADLATTSAILYAVLPAAPGLTYLHVVAIFLAGFTSGSFSGLPGGVGVFDSVLLFGLSAYMPPAAALGGILLFRVMYFLIPACVAGVCYAGHELWTHASASGEKP